MKIDEKVLKEAFRQAQDIATKEMEEKAWEPDETEPDRDWEMLYEAGRVRKKKKRTGYRKRARIAAAVMLALTVGIASAFTAAASQIGFIRTLTQWFVDKGDSHDDFLYKQSEQKEEASQPPQTLETIYEPTYIPDGFELAVDDLVGGIGYTQGYVKGKKDIWFSQNTINATISIDSENMKRETVVIQGYEGQMNSKKGETILVWATDEYIFEISSSLGKEEVLKVAESVAVKE